MTFDPVKFGERIKQARKLRNMTQEQLAEKMNISLDHLKHLEGASKSCSIDILIGLSESLNVSTDYLLMGTSSEHNEEKRAIENVISELSDLVMKL